MAQVAKSRPDSSEVIFRPAKESDIKFIMSSWKMSWRTCPWAGCIRNDEFYASIRSTIEGLLGRGATLTVACTTEHPDAILGWLCSEVLPDGLCAVHYTYTKDPYLRMEIGAKLVEHAAGTKPGLYTFRFRQVTEACPGWRHAPEVARRR